ncbi:hypothetical protein AB0O07_01420 [Streptomyces sp. NPDC093085]|uniref:hypothetical protein n=1 Tax=Streptomyces sp. NPDC093085 TaxID=3155068 RepID=UPI00342AE941
MTTPLVLGLSVGGALSLSDAAEVATAARDSGVSAIRLLDGGPDGDVLDTSAVAGYLAGHFPEPGWIVDAPTTHNPPYNLARRVLSLDRASAGRTGLALRAGDGDAVTSAALPDSALAGSTGPGSTATDAEAVERGARWAEYATVLTRLWESFPAAALLGDQDSGLFAETAAIRPVDHEGRFYRVAGPLDGPSSPQGRPVLVADLRDEVRWVDAVAVADAVVIPRDRVAGAGARLDEAFVRAGRPRREVAVLGRVEWPAPESAGGTGGAGEAGVERDAAEVAEWAAYHAVDGVELVPTGGDAGRVATLLRALAPRLRPAHAPTLRAALGLPELSGAVS